jgi:hypothetical protein
MGKFIAPPPLNASFLRQIGGLCSREILNQMKTKTVFTTIAAILQVLPQLLAATPDIPPGIQLLAQNAIQQIGYWKVSWVPGPAERERYENRISIFDADLDKLAELINEAVAGQVASIEGNNMEAKIATLAYQRKLHRDLFDEIESTYCTLPKDYDPRFIFKSPIEPTGVPAPAVQKKHLVPACRYALEYCLLKYENYHGKRDWAGFQLTNALTSLGDDRSLIVWEFLYGRAVLAQKDQLSQETEGYCRAIWYFPGTRGVAALLKFYELSKTGRPDLVDWRTFETPADYFIYLYGKGSPEQKENWKAAIGSYNQSGLTEEQWSLLKGIVEFQPPGPAPRRALIRERRPAK